MMKKYLYLNAQYLCETDSVLSIGNNLVNHAKGDILNISLPTILEIGSLKILNSKESLSLNDFNKEYSEKDFLDIMHEFEGFDFSYAVFTDSGIIHTMRLDYFKNKLNKSDAFSNPYKIKVTRSGGAVKKPIKSSLI